MTADFDYPPSQTYTLAAALDTIEDRVNELKERIDDLEAQRDNDDEADVGEDLVEARNEKDAAENKRDALQWAVNEFGEDAELTLEAYTTKTRSRTIDTFRAQTVGAGSEELNDWLVAAGVADAPWMDDGADLQERADVVGELPPALTDWIEGELDDLNNLAEGN
jgi:hypothetical protein